MTFAPPNPETTSTRHVPGAQLFARIVRCDYPINGNHGQWGYTATRNNVGDWTLSSKGNPDALTIPGAHVAWVRVTPADTTIRKTPGWAIVVGVLGLFVFLLGALFFLVKTTEVEPGALVEVAGADGRVLAFRCAGVDANTLRVQLGAF